MGTYKWVATNIRTMLHMVVPLALVLYVGFAPAPASAFSVGASLPQLHIGAGMRARSMVSLRMNTAGPVVAGAKLTFTQEMRAKAMSLHTFSQAPKEGKARDKTANTVVDQWQTTKQDFLQFLTDSLVVYEAFEVALQKPELELLRNSGLERVERLKTDIAFVQATYAMSATTPSTAAIEYSKYLQTIETPVFVCHFYNYYFAHTAGGRMIGTTVMNSEFGGHLFEFYQWDREVKDILTEVKSKIDVIANTWTREQKDASLSATPDTFQKAGALLRVLVGKARDRAAQMTNKVETQGGKITKVPTSSYAARKAAWDL